MAPGRSLVVLEGVVKEGSAVLRKFLERVERGEDMVEGQDAETLVRKQSAYLYFRIVLLARFGNGSQLFELFDGEMTEDSQY